MRPLIFISNNISKNYPDALAANGFDFTFTDYDLADGLLIPGGGDVSPCLAGTIPRLCKNVDVKLDMLELYLIKRFMIRNKPILGICRGLQVVNVFFSGTLYSQIFGHSAESDVNVECKFFGVLKKAYPSGEGVVSCNHRQRIDILGDRLKVCALSYDDVIEAVSYKNVIATQFHPERTCGKTDGNEIFKLFRTYFH